MKFKFIALCCAIFYIFGVGTVLGVQEYEKLKSPYGELSHLTFVCGDAAYIKIFSGISTSDVTNIWNDFIVLAELEIKKVHIFINSPGGDAFTGLALADEINRAENNGFDITAHASGIVASAAVPIFASCDTRYAAPGTIFMVHEAAMWKWPGRETASDIRSQNDLMVMLQDRYISILVSNSILSEEEWKVMERKTTWFDVEKAVEYGLVDKIE